MGPFSSILGLCTKKSYLTAKVHSPLETVAGNHFTILELPLLRPCAIYRTRVSANLLVVAS